MRVKTIKGKLVLYISTLVIAILIIGSLSTTFVSRSIIQTKEKEKLELKSEKSMAEINDWMDKMIDWEKAIADTYDYALKDKSNKEILSYLTEKLNANDGTILDTYIGFEDKSLIMVKGKPAPDFEFRTRPWYVAAKESNSVVVTDPYIDEVTGEMVITVAMPVHKDGKVNGVAGMDIYITKLIDLVSNVSEKNGTYGFLVDSSNKFIVHNNKKYILSSKRIVDISVINNGALKKAIKNNEKVFVSKDYDNEYKYFSINNISSCNWKIGIVTPKKVVSAESNFLLFLSLIINLIGIIAIIILIRFISNKILASIGELKQFASGDFSKESESVLKKGVAKGFKDEVEEIKYATKTVKKQIRDTILGTKSEADEVNKISDVASKNMEELSNELVGIDESIKAINEKADKAADLTKDLNDSSALIGEAINKVASKATESATQAEDITERADKLMREALQSQDNTNSIYEETHKQLQEAIEASKKVSDIQALTDEILSIANQTNLIALNASIEAARAGEAGKGFAVVAEEIRNLSDSSTEAVDKIQGVIAKVVDAVSYLNKCSSKLLDFMDKQVIKDYSSFVNTINQYKEDSIFYSNVSSDLQGTSEELNSTVNEMIGSISLIADLSKEIARETLKVSESTNTSNVNSVQVLQKMRELNETSEKLREIIGKFKV